MFLAKTAKGFYSEKLLRNHWISPTTRVQYTLLYTLRCGAAFDKLSISLIKLGCNAMPMPLLKVLKFLKLKVRITQLTTLFPTYQKPGNSSLKLPTSSPNLPTFSQTCQLWSQDRGVPPSPWLPFVATLRITIRLSHSSAPLLSPKTLEYPWNTVKDLDKQIIQSVLAIILFI